MKFRGYTNLGKLVRAGVCGDEREVLNGDVFGMLFRNQAGQLVTISD